MKPVLSLRLSDLWRATLADECGNEGFIGIAPDGSEYHVVVPVDRQIARGLRFDVPPEDGTPFGGYRGWHYFCCLTYPDRSQHPDDERHARLERAWENAWLIQKWGQGLGIEIELVEDFG